MVLVVVVVVDMIIVGEPENPNFISLSDAKEKTKTNSFYTFHINFRISSFVDDNLTPYDTK